MQYWSSTSQFEVDIIVNDSTAIEVKSSQMVSDKHLKGLRALKEEKILKHYFCISQDSEVRITNDKIVIYPWNIFLKKLWNGEIF